MTHAYQAFTTQLNLETSAFHTVIDLLRAEHVTTKCANARHGMAGLPRRKVSRNFGRIDEALAPKARDARKSNDYNLKPFDLIYPVKMALAVSKKDVDFSIKPEAVTPTVDTSDWPVLLKNYDKRELSSLVCMK